MKKMEFSKKLALFLAFPLLMLLITIVMNMHFISTYEHSNQATSFSNHFDLYNNSELIKTKVTLPSSIYVSRDDDLLILKGQIPTMESNEVFLTSLIENTAIEILINGELRYSYDPEVGLATNSNFASVKLIRLKLQESDFGAPIEIVLKPSVGFNNVFDLPDIVYGAGESSQYFASNDFYTILVNFAILLCATIGIGCYCMILLKEKRIKDALIFGLFILFYINLFLIFTVFSSKSIYIFLPYPFLPTHINMVLVAILPFSFFSYVTKLFKQKIDEKVINILKITIWPCLAIYFITFYFGLDKLNFIALLLFIFIYFGIIILITYEVINFNNIPHYVKSSVLIIPIALVLNMIDYFIPNNSHLLITIKQSVPSFITVLLVIYSISSYFEKNRILLKKNVLSELAFKDPLSGCYNRQAYQQRIEQSLDAKYYYIMIDINNMKTINDTEGHEKGDEAIRLLGAVVIPMLKEKSHCYRIGGDEFVILAACSEIKNIEIFIQEIATVYNDKSNFEFTLSIGYSVISNKDKQAISDAIKDADYKMYNEKQKFHKYDKKPWGGGETVNG